MVYLRTGNINSITMNPKQKNRLLKILYIIGIVALLLGAIDAMEGSIVIAFASILLVISTHYRNDKYWKLFFLSFVLISIGVSALFTLSAMGGIGGDSGNSAWLGLAILPYPVGWILSIVLLIMKAFQRSKKTESAINQS